MQLSLILDGNPILRKVSNPVKRITPAIIKLIHNMHVAMKQWNGVGLSAIQVGFPIELFVVGTKDCPRLTIINPKLLSYDKDSTAARMEGCLSFPGTYKYRNRPDTIKLEYTDMRGNVQVGVFSGLTAQVILHEMMHLKGVTLNDNDVDNTDILLYTDNKS